jgi:hypothetical protein
VADEQSGIGAVDASGNGMGVIQGGRNHPTLPRIGAVLNE